MSFIITSTSSKAFQGVVWSRFVPNLQLCLSPGLVSDKCHCRKEKKGGIKSELPLSQTVALFLPISVDCRCLGRLTVACFRSHVACRFYPLEDLYYSDVKKYPFLSKEK